ncbi:MAG: pilus assembly protein [Phycicoccus sp.]|nr:pilus assembly protein [Phycicoccus sp.]NMM33998.1 pilus assembly protein [Phycicoccus sp.]
MRQLGSSGPGAQAGSAVVEFVFLAVLMLVPLFYLVMVLARLQAGAYAVSAASREAGRAYVTAQVSEQAPARAHSAAGLAFADQGFESEGSIKIGCDGTPCLRPEGRVQITATLWVPMPLVPAFFAAIVPLQMPVSATHLATVDRFGGQR